MKETDSSQQKNKKKAMDLREQNMDKEALFLGMVETYQDAIFRFLYFRVSNRTVALDITQDTFTKTWMYLADGKTIEYPEAFLYRTAKNALIDYYKKQKSSSLDTMMDAGFDPESTKDLDEIDRNDEIADIRALLEELDEESRHIIYLRFTEEKPIEEIALLYDKSPNAMTVHIHRIIKKLKEKWKKD
jgi:RNA polymerase sigma-70 factor (ECF subfamily)